MPPVAAAAAVPAALEVLVIGAGAAYGYWRAKTGVEAYKTYLDTHDSDPSVAVSARHTVGTALINTVTDPAYQAEAKLTVEQARQQAIEGQLALSFKVRELVFPIEGRSFTSVAEAVAWYNAAGQTFARGYLTPAENQRALAVAQSEIARLTPTIPKFAIGQTLQWAGAPAYVIEVINPGPPISYALLNPAIGAVITLLEATLVNQGATVIGGPAAPTIPAVPAVPAAAAVPQVIVPGLEGVGPAIGGLTSALPGIMGLAGIGAISGLLANAATLGEGMHTGSLKSQLSAGQKMLELITGIAGPVSAIALMEAPGIKDAITDPITDWVFSTAVDYIAGSGHIRPEDAPIIARRVFEAAIAAGLAAHAASVVAEISTPLKNMGLGYLAAFAADMAGFSRIAAATVGVVESRGIALPMGYYINSKVRSQLPSTGELARLAGEYHLVPEALRRQLAQTDQGLDEIDRLNRQQYYYWMPFHGIADMWLPTFYDGTHRGAGDRLLRFMAAQGIWDPTYYRTELLRSGYELDTARHSLSMLYSLAHGELKTLFTGTAVSRYKEGLDNDGALISNLTMLGVGEQLLPKYVHAAHLAADLDDYTDELATLRAAVAKKLISPDTMEQELLGRLGRPEKARILADRERIRMTGTTKVVPRDTAIGLTVDIAAGRSWAPPRPRPVSLGLAIAIAAGASWTLPKPRETDIGLTVSVPGYKTTPAPELRPVSVGLQITIEE